MIKRIVFLVLVGYLCLTFASCKKIPTSPVPEETKHSILQITISSEPVFLIFNWPAYYADGLPFKGETTVAISEINGVGCEIDRIDLKFAYQNGTYEPSSFEGSRLSSYGKLERSINLSVGYGAYEFGCFLREVLLLDQKSMASYYFQTS